MEGNERYEGDEIGEYPAPSEKAILIGGIQNTIVLLVMSVLIILKALGIITLSWWWIFLPVWGPFALILTIMGGMIGVGILAFIIGLLMWGVLEICVYIKNLIKKVNK